MINPVIVRYVSSSLSSHSYRDILNPAVIYYVSIVCGYRACLSHLQDAALVQGICLKDPRTYFQFAFHSPFHSTDGLSTFLKVLLVLSWVISFVSRRLTPVRHSAPD